MIALSYVRRSMKSDANTVSLDVQREAIATYARDKLGTSIVDTIEHDGVSGGKRARFDVLRQAIVRHKATYLLVYHIDRLGRDQLGTLGFVEWCDARGVELHSVSQGRLTHDTSDAILTTGIHALLAQHYRKLVSEKTRAALARLRANGRRTSGWAPYGYRFSESGHLIPDPAEQSGLVAISALSGCGLSLRGLSRALAARGILARNSRPFAAMTLARLVANQASGRSRDGVGR